jgi:hypothetical protein
VKPSCYHAAQQLRGRLHGEIDQDLDQA